MSTPARRHICPIIVSPRSEMVAPVGLPRFRHEIFLSRLRPAGRFDRLTSVRGANHDTGFQSRAAVGSPLNSVTNPIGEKHERDD